MKYTISRWDGSQWVWCGDGDTDNGTTAQLPDEVYEFADSGETGEIEAEGETYRVQSN